MKLIKAQVQTYRSIVDSGTVDIEERVTVVIGKNEQGKTTFLRSIPEGHVNATARTRHRGRTTWIFDVEILLLAKMLSIPVEEVPIEWHEVPGSKLNVVTDSLQMLRDLLILRANHLLGRWKVSQNTIKVVPS